MLSGNTGLSIPSSLFFFSVYRFIWRNRKVLHCSTNPIFKNNPRSLYITGQCFEPFCIQILGPNLMFAIKSGFSHTSWKIVPSLAFWAHTMWSISTFSFLLIQRRGTKNILQTTSIARSPSPRRLLRSTPTSAHGNTLFHAPLLKITSSESLLFACPSQLD